ncbi:MAG: RHS repeat-associated core domain-containing protein, partial [Cellvibrionales bacterium]|nr:RHS repeat-associated core domain-containing protein [Cellvibrionales bacterium]
THYLHQDHLGSLDLITNTQAQIVQAFSFDAFGKRRHPQDWQKLGSKKRQAYQSPLTTRGYTGHEMLDTVGLIHMNGRIYAPQLGRFLQADPFIQAPTHSQSLNRYSYVLNNPLNATDPTGYFVFTLAALVYTAVAEGIKWYVVSAIFAAASFADTLVAGGSLSDALRAGAISGLSAAAFSAVGASNSFSYAIGDGLEQLAINAVANGVVGGITSILSGGKFGHMASWPPASAPSPNRASARPSAPVPKDCPPASPYAPSSAAPSAKPPAASSPTAQSLRPSRSC